MSRFALCLAVLTFAGCGQGQPIQPADASKNPPALPLLSADSDKEELYW
jgi:hypothetical protein